MSPPLPSSFLSKKARIISQLAVPMERYDDLSPKGSIDEGIRELIDEINALEGCVTTSSCAGRVAAFVEGKRSSSDSGDEIEGRQDGESDGGRRTHENAAGVGGKGGGGRWLFVSHDPVAVDTESTTAAGRENEGCSGNGSSWAAKLGMTRDVALEDRRDVTRETRYIHFKFEPMILHILTASLHHAQLVLSAALQAGFRESGALNLTTSSQEPATPMVGVRSMGLGLESVVGYERDGEYVCMVPEWQLRNLVMVANGRFVENGRRIERFREFVRQYMGEGRASQEETRTGDSGAWESKEERRERKRAEGLRRAREMKERETRGNNSSVKVEGGELPDLGPLALEQNL